ncbi:MAG: hypothetical protein VKM98_05380 [Cyanobacteriota bacterium]|nr:hypothetical protein [Cyanobacteriota bacterium]
MNFSADTATTHVGWRQVGSDAAADADHLLIRSDWGSSAATKAAAPDEPLISFVNPDDAQKAAEDPAAEAAAEQDAEVNDAALDAPPYLWGGESFGADTANGPGDSGKTVFS